MKSLGVALALFLAATAGAEPVPPDAIVSSQGRLALAREAHELYSPLGRYRLDVQPRGGGAGWSGADLILTGPEGYRQAFSVERGNGFLIADEGSVVVIDAAGTNALPTGVSILDRTGRVRLQRAVDGLVEPGLSSDGTRFFYRQPGRVAAIALATLAEAIYPELAAAAAGPGQKLAGLDPENVSELVQFDAPGQARRCRLVEPALELAYDPAGTALFVLARRTLSRLDLSTESWTQWIEEPAGGAELIDLLVDGRGVQAGARRSSGSALRGERIEFGLDGRLLAREEGPARAVPAGSPPLPGGGRSIPWPLAPDSQHPVGNTYGEYQDYGGGAYLHPGVDVMGSIAEPVYAVSSGVVKAILTISGEWHWRVAVGDEDTPATCPGYLYAHLERYSIAVSVGDTVVQGQYLGDLVDFPDFVHCHFARIECSGQTWNGSWLCNSNPHLDFENQNDVQFPVFAHARGGDWFAFCNNGGSAYQSPAALQGAVDIIVRVGDLIQTSYACSVQEIRYSIFPAGDPGHPVIDDQRAVFFDMPLDSYQGGSHDELVLDLLYKQDPTCHSQGDYDARIFYHIITNSNGDDTYELADFEHAWHTELVSDGEYIVRVTAADAVGNAVTQDMLVVTANGVQPTVTPTATETPLPTETPEATVEPTPPPATPTPQPTVPPGFGVRIELPAMAHPGREFHVTGYLDNPAEPRPAVPVFFVLEVAGDYWFWPDWKRYAPPESTEVDWENVHVGTGSTPIEVVPVFQWPDTGSDEVLGLHFYGAMLNAGMTAIEGEMAVAEWGYGPALAR